MDLLIIPFQAPWHLTTLCAVIISGKGQRVSRRLSRFGTSPLSLRWEAQSDPLSSFLHPETGVSSSLSPPSSLPSVQASRRPSLPAPGLPLSRSRTVPTRRMLRLPRSEPAAHPLHAAPVSPPQGPPVGESRFSALSLLRGTGHKLSLLSPYVRNAYLSARTSPRRPSPLPALSAVSLMPVMVPGMSLALGEN